VLFDTTQLALERAIEGAGKRHEALAANIANANTPGYQRVDVDFHGALQAAMGGDEDSNTALEGLSFSAAKDASAGATRADGSTVELATAISTKRRIDTAYEVYEKYDRPYTGACPPPPPDPVPAPK